MSAAPDPPPPEDGRPLAIEDFLGDPTRDLEAWHRLLSADRSFPVAARPGPLGRLVIAVKRLLRPLVKAPQADLWDRQRVLDLVLLEHLINLERRRHEERIHELEGFRDNFVPRSLDDVLRHNDALFSRVDQKLDRHRREVRDLVESLGSALAVIEESRGGEGAGRGADGDDDPVRTLARADEERTYLAFERRFRGTEEEIRGRLEEYLPVLREAAEATGGRPVLDLGCGRGEALSLLAEHGLAARGVDASAGMVEHCREKGLEAEVGDLFETLAAAPAGSLGAVVSFHVVEHLPGPALGRLLVLAHRALARGGVLVLETPNPLSLVVAARSFWLDPTHVRPVHPEALELLAREAGFDDLERRELRPHPERDRLPEVDLAELPEAQHRLAHHVNLLRDRLDDLLYGHQDYALVARRE